MKGFEWCIRLSVLVAVAAWLGLQLAWEAVAIAGAAAILTVWVGWPVLVLMGALAPDRK